MQFPPVKHAPLSSYSSKRFYWIAHALRDVMFSFPHVFFFCVSDESIGRRGEGDTHISLLLFPLAGAHGNLDAVHNRRDAAC